MAETDTPKKGRGRPPKNSATTPTSDAAKKTLSPTQIKKLQPIPRTGKPGRPRKYSIFERPPAIKANKVKRGVGRPLLPKNTKTEKRRGRKKGTTNKQTKPTVKVASETDETEGEEEEESDIENMSDTEITVKRGRGRPSSTTTASKVAQKRAVSGSPTKKTDDGESPPKKGRGRPKKSDKKPPKAGSRGRGRPPKNAKKEESTEEDEKEEEEDDE